MISFQYFVFKFVKINMIPVELILKCRKLKKLLLNVMHVTYHVSFGILKMLHNN